MTNHYKKDLDNLLAQIETYKFTVKKLEQLFKQDEDQLIKGGQYLNESAIFIHDWDNFSTKDWLIDYQRVSIYGKAEYLKEVDEIKSTIYKHYLIETYESLIKFIVPLIKYKEKKSPKIYSLVPKIESDFHNKVTPFGFNAITFIFTFCQVRNAFTHNDSIFRTEDIDLTKKEYLKYLDIDQTKCIQFLKAYFEIQINLNSPSVRIFITKTIFDQMIKFTQSYAFSLFKYYSEKEGLSWEIQKESERLDIKTNNPLTEEQKAYHSDIIDKILKK